MEKFNKYSLIQLALVAGIVTLALAGVDGWGWLCFLLFISLDD